MGTPGAREPFTSNAKTGSECCAGGAENLMCNFGIRKFMAQATPEAALKAAQEIGLREVRPPKPPKSMFPEVG